jgi:hypothetical protein
MNTLAVRKANFPQKGDVVLWEDPDRGVGSGTYTIIDIHSDSGTVEEWDTLIVLRNEFDSIVEVFVSELV